MINDAALGEGTGGASIQAEALEAIAATRDDPWVNERVLTEGLHTLEAHAGSAEVARALMEPFAGYALNFLRRNAVLEVLANDPNGPAPLCVDALASFEPNTPWNANMLALRLRCYERHAPARSAVARAELDLYRSHTVGPFALSDAPAG